MPEDEERFQTVTYTYYEQLNGYEHLKRLDIGYFLKLSRWAERWEREHGGVRCKRRAEHNRRRAGGELVVDRKRVADARYRRSSGGEIERERVEVVENRRRPPSERWRDIVDAAQRRLHERRVWQVVQETAAPVRAEMEKAHTAEWAELRRREERDPEGDQLQQHRERAELGREQGRAELDLPARSGVRHQGGACTAMRRPLPSRPPRQCRSAPCRGAAARGSGS